MKIKIIMVRMIATIAPSKIFSCFFPIFPLPNGAQKEKSPIK